MRSATKNMENKFGGRIEEESRGALWQRDTRESIPTRVRMVHEGSDSNIHAMQKVWRKGVSYRGKQETRGDQGPTKMV